MNLASTIIEIHSSYEKLTSTKEANSFTRSLVFNIISDLQDKNDFTSISLEREFAKELEDIKEIVLKKSAT